MVSNQATVGSVSRKARVVVVQRMLTHYRVPFFEHLRSELAKANVELLLLAGQPTFEELSKHDQGHLGWALPLRNRYLRVRGRQLCWQPIFRHCRGADLVVVEQASRLLVLYPLLCWRVVGGPKVAFWGHGRNLDARSHSGLGEWIKKRLVNVPDWWFAYTEGTVRQLVSDGVNVAKITAVLNSTDTSALVRHRSAIKDSEVHGLKEQLGIEGENVGVYLGSLYPAKRVAFLLEAARLLRETLPDFHLIILGDGQDSSLVASATVGVDWISHVGAVTGTQLALYASPGRVMLNPGLVGLSVLDAFALGLPMVTCQLPYHSPEFEYLVGNENGLVLPSNTNEQEFADAVAGLLRSPSQLKRLTSGCEVSALRYSVEQMACGFADGILHAVGQPA